MTKQLTILLASLSCLPAAAQEAARISIGTGGAQGDMPSSRGTISADGRHVAFESYATNLVAGDTNDQADVFLHDRQTGTTVRVDVDAQGGLPIFGASNPAISSDGRYVVFESDSPDIWAPDQNGWTDVFVRDLLLGTTDIVSVDNFGQQGNHVSRNASISADGRYVAFESRAATLVPNDTNFTYDVFVRDRFLLTTTRVSVDSSGIEGDSISRMPSISGDGRYVAFESVASNLVPGDTNGVSDVFVHDRQTGTTIRVSVGAGGVEGDLESIQPAFSSNGLFVAFSSSCTNLVAGDLNGSYDVYVRDLVLGTTLRGSVGTNGLGGPGDSFDPALTDDGRFLVFGSYAPLDADHTNMQQDVFVRDLVAGTTVRASLTSEAQQLSGFSSYPAISGDGTVVVYTSLDNDIVANDTNDAEDVFVVAWPFAFESVCVGDGSGTACPCGNSSAPGMRAGCAHSFGDGGRLSAHGSASIANDTLELRGLAMPDSTALYFQGQTTLGVTGVVFGDGLRCAGGTIMRLGVHTNAGGESHYPAGADLPVSVRGNCAAGGSFTYQVWFRNAAAFCTASTFNLTNGVRLTWQP